MNFSKKIKTCSILIVSKTVHLLCVSDSLQPHELWHARLCCPSPTPGVYPNSRPLSQRCHPTISSSGISLLFLPSTFPIIRVFSNESAICIRWPKYCHFSFSISTSSEYSGLISFWIDWFDLLVIQGTLQNLLQHHSSYDLTVVNGDPAMSFRNPAGHLFL